MNMPRRRPPTPEDPKVAALRAAGALHPRPEAVQDDAFARLEFFDRRDRVQVKYEMLRRHRVDGRPVTEVATAFGASRQALYAAETAFTAAGLPGLLPRPRGPKRAHKCTDDDPGVRRAAVRRGAGALGGGDGGRGAGALRRRDPSALARAGVGAAKKKRRSSDEAEP